MSRVLCVWELGGDMGHMGQFLPITEELVKRGHEVFFAAKDLSRINSFFNGRTIKLLQAPVWLPRLKKPMLTRSFSEILLYQGYQSTTTLIPLVNAWKSLLDLVNPDLVVFDHAPTALLSAYDLPVKKIILSNSFVTPPAGTASVDLRAWDLSADYDIQKNENHIVDVINRVSSSLGGPTLKYTSDLYKADKIILNCFEEIDFYRESRVNAIYAGSIPSGAKFQKPVWREGSLPKVFAYFKAGIANVDVTLEVLAGMPVNVLCFYAGAKPESYEHLQSEKMRISNRPFDMTDVYEVTDAIACHAGMGMVCGSLYAGCPLILVPAQLEQINTTIRLVEMQLAVGIQKNDDRLLIENKIAEFFKNQRHLLSAKEFASNNKAINPQNSSRVICDICEDVIQGG